MLAGRGRVYPAGLTWHGARLEECASAGTRKSSERSSAGDLKRGERKETASGRRRNGRQFVSDTSRRDPCVIALPDARLASFVRVRALFFKGASSREGIKGCEGFRLLIS